MSRPLPGGGGGRTAVEERFPAGPSCSHRAPRADPVSRGGVNFLCGQAGPRGLICCRPPGSARTWPVGPGAGRADRSSTRWTGRAAGGCARRALGRPGGLGQLGIGRPGLRPRPGCSRGSSGAPWRVAAQQPGDSRRRPPALRQQDHHQPVADPIAAAQQPQHVVGAPGRAGVVGVHAGDAYWRRPRGVVWCVRAPTTYEATSRYGTHSTRRYEQNLRSPA
jgi:hypothetical protein